MAKLELEAIMGSTLSLPFFCLFDCFCFVNIQIIFVFFFSLDRGLPGDAGTSPGDNFPGDTPIHSYTPESTREKVEESYPPQMIAKGIRVSGESWVGSSHGLLYWGCIQTD